MNGIIEKLEHGIMVCDATDTTIVHIERDDAEKIIALLKEHEKDIEKRPIQNKDHPRFGMGYEYYDWICPTCRGFLAFETDEEHIPKRCPHCGQAVNLLKEQEAVKPVVKKRNVLVRKMRKPLKKDRYRW